MDELRRASTPLEAHFWQDYLLRTISPVEKIISNLRDEINREVAKKGPLATSVAAIKGQIGMESEQLAPNQIFKGLIDPYHIINMVSLRQWIYDTLVRRMQHSYGWLALLLFAQYHQLLIKDDTKSFSEQMKAWFPNVPHPCTQESVNTYRRGFFREDQYHFDYGRWINWGTPLPDNYELLKDQHPEGFKHIHTLCLALEGGDYESQIFIKNTNK